MHQDQRDGRFDCRFGGGTIGVAKSVDTTNGGGNIQSDKKEIYHWLHQHKLHQSIGWTNAQGPTPTSSTRSSALRQDEVKLDTIIKTLDEARGGWRMLIEIAAIAGTAGAVLAKASVWLPTLFR